MKKADKTKKKENIDNDSSDTSKKPFNNKLVFILGGIIILLLIGFITVLVSNDKNLTRNTHLTPASQNLPPNFVPSILIDLLAKFEKDPDNAVLAGSIGDKYFEMKKFSEAIRYYKINISLDPNNVGGFNDLGLTLFYMGKPAEAMTFIDKGISINSGLQRIWLTKGFVAVHGLKDYAQARNAFEKVIRINPDNPIAESAKEYLTKIDH